MGRVDAGRKITLKTLRDAGVVSKGLKHGIKLLGTVTAVVPVLHCRSFGLRFTFTPPLQKIIQGAESFLAKVDIEVSRASHSAIVAVEAAGGSITTVHHNKVPSLPPSRIFVRRSFVPVFIFFRLSS